MAVTIVSKGCSCYTSVTNRVLKCNKCNGITDGRAFHFLKIFLKNEEDTLWNSSV
jgi:hypothetical protein